MESNLHITFEKVSMPVALMQELVHLIGKGNLPVFREAAKDWVEGASTPYSLDPTLNAAFGVEEYAMGIVNNIRPYRDHLNRYLPVPLKSTADIVGQGKLVRLKKLEKTDYTDRDKPKYYFVDAMHEYKQLGWAKDIPFAVEVAKEQGWIIVNLNEFSPEEQAYVLTLSDMKTADIITQFREPKTITVRGRRWFRRGPGNTYHSVIVMADGKYVGGEDYAYGYDQAYLQTAMAILQEKGLIHPTGNEPSLWSYCKDNGIKLDYDVVDVVRKRDLAFDIHTDASIHKQSDIVSAVPAYEDEAGNWHFVHPLPYDQLPDEIKEKAVEKYRYDWNDQQFEFDNEKSNFESDAKDYGLLFTLKKADTNPLTVEGSFSILEWGVFTKVLLKYYRERMRKHPNIEARFQIPKTAWKALLEGLIDIEWYDNTTHVEDRGAEEQYPRVRFQWTDVIFALDDLCTYFFFDLESKYAKWLDASMEPPDAEAMAETFRANEYVFDEEGKIASSHTVNVKFSDIISQVPKYYDVIGRTFQSKIGRNYTIVDVGTLKELKDRGTWYEGWYTTYPSDTIMAISKQQDGTIGYSSLKWYLHLTPVSKTADIISVPPPEELIVTWDELPQHMRPYQVWSPRDNDPFELGAYLFVIDPTVVQQLVHKRTGGYEYKGFKIAQGFWSPRLNDEAYIREWMNHPAIPPTVWTEDAPGASPTMFRMVNNDFRKTLTNTAAIKTADILDMNASLKVYLDDIREAPSGWTRTTSSAETISLLKSGKVNELSLDHDLSETDDGYKVLLWIEEQVHSHGFIPPKMYVHSANPAARIKMELAIQAIERASQKVGGLKFADVLETLQPERQVYMQYVDIKKHKGELPLPYEEWKVKWDELESHMPQWSEPKQLTFAAMSEDSIVSDQDVETNPSQEQIEAGNYKKGHITIHGLDITIENPKGSIRKGVSPDGKEWSNKMHSDYGYIKGGLGKDGDQVDVFIGEHHDSEFVYIINQKKESGGFDEHKCVLGEHNEEDAKSTYLANYDKDWLGKQGGSLDGVSMTMEQFKMWLEYGDMHKPAKEVKLASTPARGQSGWLSPEGKYYPVEFMRHGVFARDTLISRYGQSPEKYHVKGYDVDWASGELITKGWVRIGAGASMTYSQLSGDTKSTVIEWLREHVVDNPEDDMLIEQLDSSGHSVDTFRGPASEYLERMNVEGSLKFSEVRPKLVDKFEEEGLDPDILHFYTTQGRPIPDNLERGGGVAFIWDSKKNVLYADKALSHQSQEQKHDLELADNRYDTRGRVTSDGNLVTLWDYDIPSREIPQPIMDCLFALIQKGLLKPHGWIGFANGQSQPLEQFLGTTSSLKFADIITEMQAEVPSGRRIKTTYSIVTPESAARGDYSDTGWEDQEGEEFIVDLMDDTYPTQFDSIVAQSVKWLEDKGALEESGDGGRTYYTVDPERDYTTGAEKFYGYHLEGYTPNELNAIAGRLRAWRDYARQFHTLTSLKFSTQDNEIFVAIEVPKRARKTYQHIDNLDDDLHVTMLFVPNTITTDAEKKRILNAISKVARNHSPLACSFTGIGNFDNGSDTLVALVNIPEGAALHTDIESAIEKINGEWNKKFGYLPHCTLNYKGNGESDLDDLRDLKWTAKELRVNFSDPSDVTYYVELGSGKVREVKKNKKESMWRNLAHKVKGLFTFGDIVNLDTSDIWTHRIGDTFQFITDTKSFEEVWQYLYEKMLPDFQQKVYDAGYATIYNYVHDLQLTLLGFSLRDKTAIFGVYSNLSGSPIQLLTMEVSFETVYDDLEQTSRKTSAVPQPLRDELDYPRFNLSAKNIVEKAGAIFDGLKDMGESGWTVFFTDPKTHSSDILPLNQLTVENVRAKLRALQV